VRKKRTANTPEHTWQSSGSPDDLGAAERVAYDILASRRDLLPSVDRIMNASLGAEGTLRAIGLLRDSLTNPGDVHRGPRVTIARCLLATDDT
jgi:hypothetical protein